MLLGMQELWMKLTPLRMLLRLAAVWNVGKIAPMPFGILVAADYVKFPRSHVSLRETNFLSRSEHAARALIRRSD
jgi:hypothetical protein